MGILSGLFRTRDKPKNITNGSAYSFLMGGSSSGRRVNERSAMQMTVQKKIIRLHKEEGCTLKSLFKNTSDMELFLNRVEINGIFYDYKMILTNTYNIFGIILSRLIENNREIIVRK